MRIRLIFSLLFLLFLYNSCRKEGVEPDSPFVWIGGDRTLMKSCDGGKSWENFFQYKYFYTTSYTEGLDPMQVIRDISFCNTHKGVICGDYGFYGKTNNSIVWEAHNTYDYSIFSAFIFDSTFCFFSSEGFAFKEQNLWEKKQWTADNYYSADFIDKNTGWLVGDNNTVQYTTDGTSHWTNQTTSPGNVYRDVKIYPMGSNKYMVWIVGDKGVIYKTTDNGQNWLHVPSGVTEDLTSICITSNGNVFITGDKGLILQSTNYGATFQKMNTGTSEKLNSISFLDDETGIAVGNFGTVIKTENAGKTWSYEQWDKEKHLYCVTFVKRFHQN
ncbi:MAG: hypothetical protein A2275_04940 [Bacteroidetes bacterium RIFOXYA12_FULL_35_11]|nr:MAG: hypothetical protein A2X01_10495 [Bacteroidetes bacterium GWF2_35_48]OFY78240.1 MAG: hypothetical protein A2275_04940 [Bacteroidetes bacterium RIFOXYA12_FULL_35_11]OFY95198.1 MAG: hypothetical protein A2491_18845 [Bacteroidetes bacterium RIFOXYC12_FULL_35_7]HBX49922.1 hypothetical protein [Bacteroidales bacterium]